MPHILTGGNFDIYDRYILQYIMHRLSHLRSYNRLRFRFKCNKKSFRIHIMRGSTGTFQEFSYKIYDEQSNTTKIIYNMNCTVKRDPITNKILEYVIYQCPTFECTYNT